jgi:hypothetical protein
MTVEERINKTIQPLDNAIMAFKKVIRHAWPQEHPDATLLDEAYENSPDRDKINFNDPSIKL